VDIEQLFGIWTGGKKYALIENGISAGAKATHTVAEIAADIASAPVVIGNGCFSSPRSRFRGKRQQHNARQKVASYMPPKPCDQSSSFSFSWDAPKSGLPSVLGEKSSMWRCKAPITPSPSPLALFTGMIASTLSWIFSPR
jgi:hypothetical protein